MRKIIILLMLLCLLVSQCAAQKVIVDPNVPSAAKEELSETDSRVVQKITYEAKRKSVLAILTDLSELTGVTLKAGLNKSDWQVRDRRMNIFAKDIPLANLMNSIARVMKFKWSKSEENGAWTYSLYMDRKTLLDAESKKLREEERIAELGRVRRAKAVDSMATLSSLSPQEIEKLKEDSPFLYMMAKMGVGKPLGILMAESPAIKQAFGSGQALSLDGGALSPEGQRALIEAVNGMSQLNKIIEQRKRNIPDDLAENIAKAQIHINRGMDRMGDKLGGVNPILGMLEFSYGDDHVGFPLFDPNSKIGKIAGRALLSVMDIQDKEEMTLQMKSFEKEAMDAMISDIKEFNQQDGKKAERPDDPALHVKIKMAAKSNKLDDMQSGLADAAKYAIVSDSFRSFPFGGIAVDTEVELASILQQIEEKYQYDWEKHGTILEFRDKKWYQKRAAQIPDAWLDVWRDKFKKNGTLEIDDLAQIGNLTMEQITSNLFDDPVLSLTTNFVWVCKDLMSLYAGMSQEQRKMVFSPSGLDVRVLSPEQQQLAAKFIRGRNALFMSNPEAAINISCERKQREGKQVRYVFTITTDEGPEPMKQTIDTPVYEEPREEKPKEKSEAQPKIEPVTSSATHSTPAVRPAAK